MVQKDATEGPLAPWKLLPTLTAQLLAFLSLCCVQGTGLSCLISFNPQDNAVK